MLRYWGSFDGTAFAGILREPNFMTEHKMSIRIAVIGAGLMGADHAAIVAEDLPGATLQLVCDMDAARAWVDGDPYGKAGLFDSVELIPWNRVIG